jgi:hypothetical protein
MFTELPFLPIKFKSPIVVSTSARDGTFFVVTGSSCKLEKKTK